MTQHAQNHFVRRPEFPHTINDKARVMKKKLTRTEKNELTRKNLFEAAVKVVGQIGYRDASVTDITTRAHIAQGTFYNYFDSKQDILDQLLPELGQNLLEFLGKQVGDATFLEREEKSIRAYFQFIKSKPEFYRILVEAQVYSPQSFITHAENLIRNYEAALKRTREKGFLKNYSEDEFEVIALILLGARVYLSRQFCFMNGKATSVPEHVVKTYMKFIAGGLGDTSKGDAGKKGAIPKPAEPETMYRCEIIHPEACDFAASYEPSSRLANLAPAETDFHIQQISIDLVKRATERLLGDGASIKSTNTYISRHHISSRITATCTLENTSATEGILHFRLTDEEPDLSSHLASGQVVFTRSA
jgi:AcrR family transcriptional regulator